MTERLGSPVVLLVVTTVLFAVVWHCDQAGSAASRADHGVARSASGRQTAMRHAAASTARNDTAKRPADRGARRHHSAERVRTNNAPADSPHAGVWTLALPAQIAPGLYRVVSSSGDVHWLRIVGDDHTGNADLAAGQPAARHAPARDVYRSQSGSTRWYFIRIEMPHEDVASAGTAQH